MSEPLEFDPVDWITADAIGEPGHRTFYLQARLGERLEALLVEKEQVRALSQLAQELLAQVGVTVTPDDLVTDGMELVGPVQPRWRAGTMSLGMDEDGETFVLEAEELVPDDDREPAVARFTLDRRQLVALAAYAAYVVEAGGRERCQVCRGMRDPVVGCFGCPATNGHGPRRT